MSKFSEISSHKSTIMETLATDDYIAKSLYFDRKDFLSQDLPDGFNRKSGLIYSKIFPYKFIPDINDTELRSTFITMEFATKKDKDKNIFKIGSIYFYVFTHRDLVRTSYAVLRYDYIIDRIDYLFHNMESITVGKLKSGDTKDFSIYNSNWCGCSIVFYSTLFERT